MTSVESEIDSIRSPQKISEGANMLFTILTPTYNRRHLLPVVYKSLKAQTSRDFEWLIIDGGSDDTQLLVEQWSKDSDFEIRYYRQTSAGLHGAYNEGTAHAKGELLVIMHSDDSCIPITLQYLSKAWEEIPIEKRCLYSGIWARCMDQTGAMIGPPLGQKSIYSTYHEIVYKRGFDCEFFPIVRTEVMREFPFPTLQGVRFIPEGYVWGGIGRRYMTLFIDTPLRKYTTLAESEGDKEKLTDPSNLAKNAHSIIFYCRDVLIHDAKWIYHSPIMFLKIAASCSFYSLVYMVNIRDQFLSLPWMSKIMYALAFPIGLYKYKKSKFITGVKIEKS